MEIRERPPMVTTHDDGAPGGVACQGDAQGMDQSGGVRNRHGTGTEPVRNRYGTGGTVHWLCYCATVLRFCPEDSAMAVLPAGCSVTWHCTTNFILKQTCELMWETWEMQLGNLDIHPWNIEVDTDMQKYFYVR